MRLILGAALLALGLALPTGAQAGCTLGVKSCVNGWWQVCQKCGSETCMIITASKCHRPELPGEDKLTYSPVPEQRIAQTGAAGFGGR